MDGSQSTYEEIEERPDLIVQLKRPKRMPGQSAMQMMIHLNNMAISWIGKTLAGKQSDDVNIKSTGKHACGAVAEMNDGKSVKGQFDAEDCHAEMDVIQNVLKKGYEISDIDSIQIEKQPCPRCAVILRVLDLSGKVTYKKVGQKDYPTWRFPSTYGKIDWAVKLDIHTKADRLDQQGELLTYFCTNKWWA